jgi:hypothetical protein
LARFLLGSLSHDLACRLAKRHNLEPSKKDRTWELAEKARSLHQVAEDSEIAALLFEAALIGLAGNTSEVKDDLLVETAKLYKVDLKTLRKETARSEKEKTVKLTAAANRSLRAKAQATRIGK